MKKLTRIFSIIAVLCLATQAAFGDNNYGLYQHGTIIVKGDRYYPPFEFINEEGNPDGFNVELFHALADELGLDYHIELDDWNKVRNELEAGGIDVLMGMIYSPERAQKVTFGIPHSVMTYGIFSRTGNLFLSMDELRGKEIIVQHKDRMHDFLLESGLTHSIIPVTDQLTALQLLSAGKHDAAILGNFQGAYLIRKHKFENISVTSSDIDPQDYAIAVSKNNEQLIRLLDMGLYHLKAVGIYDELYKKWFSVYEKEARYADFRNYLLTGLAVFIVLALLILALRYRLKNVRNKLHESEIRFQNIFTNENVAMLLLDSGTGQITDINPAAEKFYGYKKSEMSQMNISDITVGETGEVVSGMEKTSLGVKKFFELKHRLASGEIRDVDMYSVTVSFHSKEYLYAMVIDAADKRKAENNARELQFMMEYIIRHDPNAIAVLDKNLHFIFVSDRFVKDYNLSDNNIIGKHHYEVFPDISDRWKEVHQRALGGEIISKEEDTYFRQDGSMDYTRWECRPWHKQDGSIGGIVLYTEVITKRKRVEIELEALKNKLEIEVKEKTAELENRVKELERFHAATIEREFRLKEMRDEIDRLKGSKK